MADDIPPDDGFRLTRRQLYDLAWSRPLSELAAEFGISPNALAKICDRLLVPHPPRGHWSGPTRARNAVRPPLPFAPADMPAAVSISSRRAPSRRSRTRLPLTARRDQIAEAAAELIKREGLNAVTMKRLAREVGVSEALTYTYFANQTALLVFLAHREQADMQENLQSVIEKNPEYVARSQASIGSYLDYVERRGAMLQTLLSSSEVRNALRAEHNTRRAYARQATAGHFAREFGVSPTIATPATLIFRALSVRAGTLLANGKLSRDSAERLANTMITGAREGLLAALAANPELKPWEDAQAPLARRGPASG